MSRCFPFPPPGYAGKSNNEALIFSIKLQSESEKAISDRGVKNVKSADKKDKSSDKKVKSSDRKKDKSSDTKDRKKEKKDKKLKEKEKLRSAPDAEKQTCIDQLYKSEKPLSASKGKQSLLQRSSELLERSNVTEEHGRPVESQNASCSSDSTGNSTKWKRPSSPVNTIQSSGGNVFRIRLSSSQRGDEPCTSGSKVQPHLQGSDHLQSQGTVQPCSKRLRAASPLPQKEVMHGDQVPFFPVSTSTATVELVPRKDKGQVRSLGDKKIDSLPQFKDPSSSVKLQSVELTKKISHHEKKMRKRKSLYDSLFENLAPLAFDVANPVNDEDWLFGGRKDEETPAKRLKGTDASQGCMHSIPCSASAALQPRAQYLSDVGIYALPFTLPF